MTVTGPISRRACAVALLAGTWLMGTPMLAQAQAPIAAGQQTETYHLLIFSDAKAGQEKDFNSWYDARHIQDVVALPDMVEGRRFILNAQQFRGGNPAPGRYLALYTIRTSNLPAVFAEMNRRIRTGQTKMSDTLDMTSLKAFTYRAIRAPILDKQEAQVVPTHVQLVFTDATAGREQEYNDWYDAFHAPDVVAVPGVIKGQRFVSSDVQMVKPGPSKYLVQFDIATSDFAKTAEVFGQMAPKMQMSKSFAGAQGFTYQAIGPIVTNAAARGATARR